MCWCVHLSIQRCCMQHGRCRGGCKLQVYAYGIALVIWESKIILVSASYAELSCHCISAQDTGRQGAQINGLIVTLAVPQQCLHL